VKKNLKKKGVIEDCPKEKCKFPNTCDWNNKCMQKELLLSISVKKTFPPNNSGKKAK
jgi:hypothetical protein